jgi:hypothetical protein
VGPTELKIELDTGIPPGVDGAPPIIAWRVDIPETR